MLAVAGGKGGGGKTTTALGLAAAIVRRGGRPLVIDTDLTMPNLHVLTGVSPTPTTDELADGQALERVRQPWPANPRVGLVAAGSREHLHSALSRLDCRRGPVLVDCPAGASHDAAVPLRAADRTLLVTTDAAEALKDTVKTEAIARELHAPPVGAVVRGKESRGETYLGEFPMVGVPEVSDGPVLSSPSFKTACDSLAQAVESAVPESSLDATPTGPENHSTEPDQYPER